MADLNSNYALQGNAANNMARPQVQPTLTSQADAMLGRLDGVLGTSRNIADRLLGCRPREASTNEKSGSPVAISVERLLEQMHQRMTEIEEELSRANSGI